MLSLLYRADQLAEVGFSHALYKMPHCHKLSFSCLSVKVSASKINMTLARSLGFILISCWKVFCPAMRFPLFCHFPTQTRLYACNRGLSLALAKQVAAEYTEKDVIRAHARDELGIDMDNLTNPTQVRIICT